MLKMGNFPLCIPKQDAAIVFSDCPSTSNDLLLRHRFQIDDLDSLRNDQVRGDPESLNYSQGMDETAVLGIELDQNSVRTCIYHCILCILYSHPLPEDE